MIKDRLSNVERYKINKYFDEFLVWVGEGKQAESLPDNIKAIYLEYETNDFNLSKFENHQQYIALHYILEGNESVGIQEVNKLVPVTIYDVKDDYQHYKGKINEQILLTKGEFLVLFSNEGHVTGCIIE